MSLSTAVRNGGYNHRSNGDFDDDDLPHREMAIDVPTNFVPQPKEKPRLSNSLSKEDKNEKIKKYQTELKSRKEHEMKLQREHEFLRASLRESKKLQNLEKRSGDTGGGVTADGFVNSAFDRDADEENRPNGAAGHSLPSSSAKAKSLSGPTVDIGDVVSTQQILNLLQVLRVKLGSSSNELRVMNQLFNNVHFQDAVSLYNKVSESKSDGRPVSLSSEKLSPQICAAIQKAETPHTRKLNEILSKPPFKGVLMDEDQLHSPQSEIDELAVTEAISDAKAGQYGEDSIKIVSIVKTADPLGATVKNEGEAVVIGRIVRGGVADRTGLLHEGDEILEINDVPLRGKTINEVSDMLASMTGQLQFVIVPADPNSEPKAKNDRMTSIRALFNYDPEEDQYIPCEELGISFQTGDILHIINQDDPNWWQAYREGEEDQTLAGLVPSKVFWENREQLRLKIVAQSQEAENQSTCCPTGRKRRKKAQFNADEVDLEDILTYEEVVKYYPQPNRKRPIVLIGPPDVGRKELRQRLLETDPDRFAAAIPHTSRARREDEEDGKNYYFTAKHVFEADIRANKFVEHGHYQKDYFGTSLESICNVVNSGKICVLNLHPQALKILRSTNLIPYVVFIAAPNLEKLRINILKTSGKEVSVEHCRNVMDKGREMETKYGHYFDYIINNTDMDNAFDELLGEINRLEVEPQWVPSEWLK